MEISNVYIDPFDPRDFIIYWDVVNKTNRDLSEFRLTIWKSFTKRGPYKKISSKINPASVFSYKDRRTSKLDSWVTLYYKIEVEDLISNSKKKWGPGGLMNEPTPSDKMIISHQRKQLLNFGRDVLIFKHPREGLRCECFNTILGKIETPNCARCDGSGFLIGYDGFFFTKMFYPPENRIETTLEADAQDIVKGCWTSNFPLMRPKDILVDKQNRRYVIDSVNNIEPHAVTIKQNIVMRKIKTTDIGMRIDIPESFKKL